jgi:hypothetical protein
VRGHKLRSVVKWERALKQKGIKHMGLKQGLGVSQIYYINNIVGSTSDVEIKKTTNLETNLHGLAKFANYTVRVLAFTSAGEGVRSSPVHCTTEEDGKSHTVILNIKSCTMFTIM